ncbi:MAG: hypothetical protein QHH19_01565 [Candidatus Thermoplasmatota archaeon]|jgi:hypothetical protein|nr:hypothetical protein [Candidatus Thermoplasmatota archaeon]
MRKIMAFLIVSLFVLTAFGISVSAGMNQGAQQQQQQQSAGATLIITLYYKDGVTPVDNGVVTVKDRDGPYSNSGRTDSSGKIEFSGMIIPTGETHQFTVIAYKPWVFYGREWVLIGKILYGVFDNSKVPGVEITGEQKTEFTAVLQGGLLQHPLSLPQEEAIVRSLGLL